MLIKGVYGNQNHTGALFLLFRLLWKCNWMSVRLFLSGGYAGVIKAVVFNSSIKDIYAFYKRF